MGCYSMGKQKMDRWMVGPGRLRRGRAPGANALSLRKKSSVFTTIAKKPAGCRRYQLLVTTHYSPARAGLALEVVVGGGDVCYAHVGAVVFDFFAGAQGYYAQQHYFSQTRGVFERAGGLRRSLGSRDPVHFVILVRDAGKRLWRLAAGYGARSLKKAG